MATARHEVYEFSEEFSRVLAYRLCTSTWLYDKIGNSIEVELMPGEVNRLAAQAAQAIAHDLGHGPGSALITVQRLRRWMHEGRVSHEQICAVLDMLDVAEQSGAPTDESLLAEAVPVVRRRLQHEAILRASEDYSARKDLDRAVALINKASGLGASDDSLGVRLGGDSFAAISALKHMDRLPTGILELDLRIGGGLPRGQLGVLIGGAGDGKSIMLSQLGTFGALSGLHVLYATLELPDAIVLARMKAAATNVPINVIMDDPNIVKDSIGKLRFGPTIVKYFTPQVTTVADIREWVARCEDAAKLPVDMLIVDYADKLTDPRRKQESSGYKTMELVYEDLRLLQVERRCWGWTASQATRRGRGEKNQKLDLEHAADSAHKVRVADMVITLNVTGDGKEINLYIAKHRTGQSRVGTGPLPTAFEYGMITPVRMPQHGDDIAGDAVLAKMTMQTLIDEEPF
jgi:KaiC/GvpD/RAD55 family RecA-like ATPase